MLIQFKTNPAWPWSHTVKFITRNQFLNRKCLVRRGRLHMWPTVALRSTCMRILSTSSTLTRGKMDESAPLQKSSVSPGTQNNTGASWVPKVNGESQATLQWSRQSMSRSPDEDLTMTLIRLLTGSKFNTWSSSYLEDVQKCDTVSCSTKKQCLKCKTGP